MGSGGTDREVLANRSEVIIKNKEDKICLLIDVVIPWDRNVIQRTSKKKLKYTNQSTEIQLVWNMKCFVIPVIIGATEIVTKWLKLTGNNNKKTFSRFCTRNSCTRDIAHGTESATV